MEKLRVVAGIVAAATMVAFMYLIGCVVYAVNFIGYGFMISFFYIITQQTIACFTFIILSLVLLILAMLLVGEDDDG